MKHFLVTRFNLKNPNWKNLKNGDLVLTEKWLDHRFKLFETYCLPSVKNQKNKNFNWCLFFDNQTPEKYKNKIESLIQEHSNFHIIYIDGFLELEKSLKQFIKKSITPNDEYIITTRLDNDDIIHEGFIYKIQTLCVKKYNTIIYLTKGYQLVLGDKINQLREFKIHFNPFISLIENTNSFKTVISKTHYEWKHAKSVIKYDDTNLWVQLIHDQNYSNSKLLSNKLVSKIEFKKFGLDIPTNTPSYKKVLLLNIAMFPIRSLAKLKQWIKSILVK